MRLRSDVFGIGEITAIFHACISLFIEARLFSLISNAACRQTSDELTNKAVIMEKLLKLK